jgi:crossover junction endodeoxyribonuclease RuvC
MLILGLDPGSLHTGYGVVERRGSALRALDLGRFSCPRRLPLPERLSHLAECLQALLARWQPETVALESTFHGPNAHSLIVLSQARGVLLATLAGRGITIREYSPAEVKSAVTGNGRADKQQVARMVKLLLALDGAGWAADATDALALAICAAQRARMDGLAGRR